MKPSDRAIAQAFYELSDKAFQTKDDEWVFPVLRIITDRARELDATAAPSDILSIDAGNAADWLDRASSKWEHGPAAINPADALRLRSIAALLRATATPVVVGEDCNVARVRAKLLDRSRVGLAKYGVTTERGDLSQSDWLRHLQEELMDAAVYIEAALAGD